MTSRKARKKHPLSRSRNAVPARECAILRHYPRVALADDDGRRALPCFACLVKEPTCPLSVQDWAPRVTGSPEDF
jgi:hypothetical protein